MKIWIDCPEEIYEYERNKDATYLHLRGCLGIFILPTKVYLSQYTTSRPVFETGQLQIKFESTYTYYPGHKHAKLHVSKILPDGSRYEIKLSQLLDSWYHKFPLPK